MISRDYHEILSENYHLEPYIIRKKLFVFSETKQQSILENLATNLYKNIVDKVDQIDFGTIPKSKGYIEKIDNYDKLIECLNTLNDLIKSYNQPTTLVDIIYSAIDNLKSRSHIFNQAFNLNIQLPIIIYNTTVIGIVSGITLLINTCVEYIKDNKSESIQIAFDKVSYRKSKDHVLFTSLSTFNDACKNNTIDKTVTCAIKNNLKTVKESYETPLNEDIIALGASTFGLVPAVIAVALIGVFVGLPIFIKLVLYTIRNIAYYYFNMSQSISDYFAAQAEFLQVNAENLKYREQFKDNEAMRKKVYDKQMKWVKRFRDISNKFMIKDIKAQQNTEKQKEEDKYDNDEGLF